MPGLLYERTSDTTLRTTRTETITDETSLLDLKLARERKADYLAAVAVNQANALALLQSQLDELDAQLAEAEKLGIVEVVVEPAPVEEVVVEPAPVEEVIP